MNLGTHEAMDLHELTMSCVNSITNMGYFRNHAQDPELRSMIEKHFPAHIQDYNMKVQYLSQPQGAQSPLPVPQLTQTLQSFTPGNTVVPVSPRTDAQDFNDREIATAYLLTLKRAGREYAWAAMEMGNPEIRTFLEDAFRMCSHQAHEVWQWMVKKGYYPMEAAPQSTLNTLGQMYQVVREPAMTM